MEKGFIFAGFIQIYPAVHEIILLTEMKGKNITVCLNSRIFIPFLNFYCQPPNYHYW